MTPTSLDSRPHPPPALPWIMKQVWHDLLFAHWTAQPLGERSRHPEHGAPIGTREYMSAEQAEMGGLDVEPRTDVYALGVTPYELLTGALPFDRDLRAASPTEVQRLVRENEPAARALPARPGLGTPRKA